MSTTLKDSILALRSRLKVEAVKVDGLEEPVFVRTLTGRERDGFETACFVQKGKQRTLNTENIRAKLLVRAICDKDGARVFTDNDTDALGDIPASALDALFSVAQRLSGLSSEDVEEMAGN